MGASAPSPGSHRRGCFTTNKSWDSLFFVCRSDWGEMKTVDRNKKQRIERSFVDAMRLVHGCLNTPPPYVMAEKCREILLKLGWKDWWGEKM